MGEPAGNWRKSSYSANGGEQCVTLAQVKMDLDRKWAEDEVKKGHYEAGANAYLKIWNEAGQPACEGKQPLCRRMDEVLPDAFGADDLE